MKTINTTQLLKENKEINAVLTPSQLKKILPQFGKKLDKKGNILEKDGLPSLANDNKEIKFKQLGALAAGSVVLIRKSIASFSDFLSKKNTE